MSIASEIEKFWYSTFAKCEKSGLTIKEFCRQKDVALGKYMYWRKKLILNKNTPSPNPTSLNNNKLKEIEISTSSMPEKNVEDLTCKHIRIIYPNGIDIKIPIAINQEKITKIFSELGGALC